ncbi:two-component system, NarL family, sensor histidine kinase DegS [Salinibacillus kushneri]|uniref:Signal transduction histidine-protein kinase/phosphatase DegS n=1 Tax=Salinibacillus kushneri TaxID=237682 RepID=A0A1H9YSM0_9BACI|nr:sensor histidine kinase [Salinibacillus kushneri]SES72085.1 two-component system, NarL family, sensor histidine kinase DegS [Salinibacillus kushneri]
MTSSKVESNALNNILDEMVTVVIKSKDEIFEIGEQSRKEYEQVEKELEQVKRDTVKVIETSDELEKKVNKSRVRLSEVSKNFDKYQEAEVKAVYDETHKLQSELFVLREKEEQLKNRRDELERRLLSISNTVDRAENLLGKISVVLNYLTDDLQGVYDELESAKEKETFGLKIIDAQEEERRRLSREIHDGPAQLLANVMLRSDLIERTFRERGLEEAIKEVQQVRQLVRSALYEVRRIIYDLRPMALDDLGLFPTLKKYLDSVSDHSGIHIKFTSRGQEERLDSKYETAFFRLVQEAVQNAVKHAEASLIQVHFELRMNQVNILVIDNGKGFDFEEKEKSSFGLIGMKERIEMLGGTIQFKTEPQKGTKIVIQVPLKN